MRPVASKTLDPQKMNGLMKRILSFLVLLTCASAVQAQSPRERIANLRDLLKTADRNEAGKVVPTAATEPVAAEGARGNSAPGPVSMQLSDRIAPSPQAVPTRVPVASQPAARIAERESLPPGVEIPAQKIPLPRTYHGQPLTPGPAGAKEPDVGRRSEDPWDLARRLGIADNPSYPIPDSLRHDDLMRQTESQAFAKSEGCIHCHTNVGHMHPIDSVQIGCTDCHGGNANCFDIKSAHVWPRFAPAWKDSANPVRSYTILNHESPEFIRFMNPGDLRVAHIACGQCHANEVLQLRKSMMTHGCMLWGAALYNNGGDRRQVFALWRIVQHERRAADHANRAAADARTNTRKGHPAVPATR